MVVLRSQCSGVFVGNRARGASAYCSMLDTVFAGNRLLFCLTRQSLPGLHRAFLSLVSPTTFEPRPDLEHFELL